MADEDQQQSLSATELIAKAAQLAVLTVGLLYGIGLLIVNMDLGRYGIVSLNLARPEYIMAGILWVFLTGVGFAIIQAMEREIRKSSRKDAIQITFILLTAISLPFAILSALSYGSLKIETPQFWAVLLIVYVNSGVATGLWKHAYWLLSKKIDFLDSLLGPARFGLSSLMLIVNLVGAIGSYTWVVYPKLNKEFGGGQKAIVDVYFVNEPPVFLKNTGMVIRNDAHKLESVSLLFDNDPQVVVAAIEANLDSWLPQLRRTGTAVSLDKKLISAIVYNPREQRVPATTPPATLQRPPADPAKK